MAEHTVDGPCCSAIDSGRALSLRQFSSFIPYHWILRGWGGGGGWQLFPVTNGRRLRFGDKLTQTLRLICLRLLFLLIKTLPSDSIQ